MNGYPDNVQDYNNAPGSPFYEVPIWSAQCHRCREICYLEDLNTEAICCYCEEGTTEKEDEEC